MKPLSIRFAWTSVVALAAASAGCQSPSQYVSPRVEGRVVDEQTQQPIQGVSVRRGSDMPQSMEQPRGAQKLVQPPPIYSGADGRFVLGSARDLAFIRRLHWYSVTLSFSHSGYEPLTRTYSLNDSTNTTAGEPLIQAGDIPLSPSPN